LDVQKSYLTSVYEEYLERRNFLIEGLNKIPGVYSPIPMGAFYTVAKLPVDDAEAFCKWCLTDFSYKGATVMLAPASGFYTEPGEGRQEVRIAYVLNIKDLAAALECLAKALEAYPGANRP
jgi:aspartate aminotransferase